MRRAAIAAGIALAWAGSAGAHGIGPHAGLVNTIVGTEPLVPGIRAQIRGTHERLVVRNYTPNAVVIFDAAGRPFKRLEPGQTETWREPRISWRGPVPKQQGPLKNWRIPGETDGRRFAIVGFLGYVPPPSQASGSGAGAETSPWLIVGAIAGGVLALVGLGVGARLAQRAPTS